MKLSSLAYNTQIDQLLAASPYTSRQQLMQHDRTAFMLIVTQRVVLSPRRRQHLWEVYQAHYKRVHWMLKIRAQLERLSPSLSQQWLRWAVHSPIMKPFRSVVPADTLLALCAHRSRQSDVPE